MKILKLILIISQLTNFATIEYNNNFSIPSIKKLSIFTILSCFLPSYVLSKDIIAFNKTTIVNDDYYKTNNIHQLNNNLNLFQNNPTSITCPNNINYWIPSETNINIDGLDIILSCKKTDDNFNYTEYFITNNNPNFNKKLYNNYELSLLNIDFIKNEPINNQYYYTYNSLLLFDNSNSNENSWIINSNDIIFYSINVLYKLPNNTITKSSQFHLGVNLSGNGLTYQQLVEQRLNIIMQYKKINHSIQSFRFFYRNQTEIYYFLDKNENNYYSLLPGYRENFLNSNNQFHDFINTINGNNYVEYPGRQIFQLCPPVLLFNGTDLNINCKYIKSFIINNNLNLLENLQSNLQELWNSFKNSLSVKNITIKTIITIIYGIISYKLSQYEIIKQVNNKKSIILGRDCIEL
jgi:hypothetical protein